MSTVNDLRAMRDLLRRGYLWYSHRGLTSTLERMTGMLGDRRAPSARSYTSWLLRQEAAARTEGTGAGGTMSRDEAASALRGVAPDAADDRAAPLVISALVPVFDPPVALLAELFASVRGQEHAAWQLVLCDAGCRDADVLALLARLAADEPRVTVVRAPQGASGISAATNAAAAAARGEVLVLLDHDDVLARGVLGRVASAFAADPRLELLYTDEDQLTAWGARVHPALKPGPSPVLLLGFNYVTHLLALRRPLWDRLGGLRAAFDGAQDHDLALRGFESAARVAHLPGIGYHWRRTRGSVAESSTAKPWAYEAGRRAVEEACARRGLAIAAVAHGAVPGVYALAPTAPAAPLSAHVVLRGPERGCAAWTLALSLADSPVRPLSLSRNAWPVTVPGDGAAWLVVDATLRAPARGGDEALALLLAWAVQPGAGGAAASAIDGRRRRDAGWSVSVAGLARPVLAGLPAHAAGAGLLASSTREVAAACGGLLCVHAPPPALRAALAGQPASDADALCLSMAAHGETGSLLFVPGCRPRSERNVRDDVTPPIAASAVSQAGRSPASVDLASSAGWSLVSAVLPADFWRDGSDRYCPRHELLVPLGMPAPESAAAGRAAPAAASAPAQSSGSTA